MSLVGKVYRLSACRRLKITEVAHCSLSTAEVLRRPGGQVHASNGLRRVTRAGRQVRVLRRSATGRAAVPQSTSTRSSVENELGK